VTEFRRVGWLSGFKEIGMGERKALSKKVRFEVFKRDSFTFQYCGKSAPAMILEVDHLKPVSKDGDNDWTSTSEEFDNE